METVCKPGRSRPSTILFATEIPANAKALHFAIASAREFNATLILFHVYDTMVVAASETSGIRYYDYAAAAHAEMRHIEPIAEQVRDAGVACEVVLRPGLAADQILAYLREREIDRVVMGTRSPGPFSKLFVGSVAEAVLRSSPVPTLLAGPESVDAQFRSYATQVVLCALTMNESSHFQAALAAEIAAVHKARLILENVLRPQDSAEELAGLTVSEIEKQLLSLIPEHLRDTVEAQAIVVPGDPAEELLFQARAQMADLIVIGAHGATPLAALGRPGVVYKVVAESQCPVLTLSPVFLGAAHARQAREHAPKF